ncbi:hypothetical protein [Eisenbergiella massiliensis]|uniref:hypothetical protein n=1 Tax=Eisenbergiella massiliensis TaxID=1720294 RepID=UPI00399AF710
MARYKDLSKQAFGKLTVREYAGTDKFGASLWLCDCKCGGTKIVSAKNLKNGYTKSCGCIPSNEGIDITDKEFGRLKAIRPTDKRDGHGSVIWECKCSCGNPKVYVSVRNLISGNVTSCGCKKTEAGKKIQPKATEGAKKSLKSGRFETNINAKHWVLIAPDGTKHTCVNLSLWARAHTDLFGLEPGDKSAKKIVHGFTNLAQTFYDTRSDVYSYKGWRIEEAPGKPDKKTKDSEEILKISIDK